MPLIERLTVTKPDDWHLRVRDAALLRRVVPDSARAIIMPNSQPPITTNDLARQYREHILAAPASRKRHKGFFNRPWYA